MTNGLPDANAIVKAVASGLVIRDVATANGVTEAEVRSLIDQQGREPFRWRALAE